MKKLMAFFILGCLLLGLANAAAAETTIYLDVLGSGSYNLTDKNTGYTLNSTSKFKFEGEPSGFFLGSESSFDKLKVGFEYGRIATNNYKMKVDGKTQDDYTFNDSSVFAEVKGGYRVVDQQMWKLDLIAEVLDINTGGEEELNSDTVKVQYNMGGNMLGADFVIDFSNKIRLQGTLATSLLGSNYSDFNSQIGVLSNNGDPSLTEIKLKFNYFLTDHFAVALGYRSYEFSSTDKEKDLGYKVDADGSIRMYTLGGAYKF